MRRSLWLLPLLLSLTLAPPAHGQGALLSANIAAATSGNNTLVTGIAGRSIRVQKMIYQAQGTVTVILKCGGTTVMPTWSFTAGTGVALDQLVTPDQTHAGDDPLFACAAGQDFIMTLNGNVAVNGKVWYALR